MRRVFLLFVALAFLNGCVTTFHKLETVSTADRRIVLLSPDVELSILNAGGTTEPNVEWTRAAEGFIATTLEEKLHTTGAELVVPESMRSLTAADDDMEVQLVKLHGAVGSAILIHQYGDAARLPSKKGKFEWGLGPEAKYLKEKYGADYALFVFVRDSYTSGGRVVAIVLAAAMGFGLQGGQQLGFVSLVDLETGDVVWFNRLFRGTGDLRTAEGAKETVGFLMKGFPE